MEKMRMESVDTTAQNVEKIGALFPNCVTETVGEDGNLKKAINFEMLKQMLSGDVLEGDEAYEFTWVGKKAAIVEANKPIRKTLRPCPEESKDWDTTENLYIEGDNLEVLKLLQESYLGQVKMIYIDPPYNTGHDFVYPDSFIMDNDEYNEGTGYFDEEGNVNFSRENGSTAGKYHSDWCSMIYSRLLLARNLLTDDGVIFISIDDNELSNLIKIADQIFGVSNRIGCILWKKKTNGNNMGYLPPVHDYILCYAKNISSIEDMGYPVTDEFIKEKYSNPDNDPRGPWTTSDLSANHKGPYFAVENPDTGEIFYPPEGRYWVFNETEVKKRIEDGRIIFGKTGRSRPVQKVFAANRKFSRIRAESWWDHHGMNSDATEELKKLFGASKLFSHPKPTTLIKNLVDIASKENDLIMDFFSGSATTAHAVMKKNVEDDGHRKFIMVQLPEPCDEKEPAYKAGYINICDIGKERIRRAGEKIKEEHPDAAENLDVGFRVLKLDDSNMKDVYYSADALNQANLFDMVSNIKEDRNDLDLLFGCVLDWGLPLSMPYHSETIDGCTVHTYNDGDLVACFDENVPESVVTEIAKRTPLRAVFRDASFANSSDKINVFEIFKRYMPESANEITKRVKVI